jgi:hypothetical protein
LGFSLFLLRPRGLGVPVIQQLVRTPWVSERVAASLIYWSIYAHTFSNPPRPLILHDVHIFLGRRGGDQVGGKLNYVSTDIEVRFPALRYDILTSPSAMGCYFCVQTGCTVTVLHTYCGGCGITRGGSDVQSIFPRINAYP